MFGLTLALMVGRPLIVGPKPQRPVKRLEALAYTERALTFTVLLIGFITATGVGAILQVRVAKEEYRKLAAQNMKAMIEGALNDKSKRAKEQNVQSD